MVRLRKIKGRKTWEIDKSFYRVDGTEERYRRAAQVQSKEGAEAEESRVVQRWLAHGTLEPPKDEPQAKPNATWEHAVAYCKQHHFPGLKQSTRDGYEQLLASKGFARFTGRKLLEVRWAAEYRAWMLEGVHGTPSSRRNHAIVLRCVLRSVSPNRRTAEPGVYFHAMPLLPGLPRVGRTVVRAPSEEQVGALLGEARPKHCGKAVIKNQLPLALAVYAGLRASEVRGLKVRDVDLHRGVIVVRTGLIRRTEGTPKSGHEREIPIGPQLRVRLEARLAEPGLKPDSHVCTSKGERPWSDGGILNAFHRAAKRVGIEGLTFHSLRHFYITTITCAGEIRTAQTLAGHANVQTTMRYSHTTLERARAVVQAAFG